MKAINGVREEVLHVALAGPFRVIAGKSAETVSE
jgi:hypothetical protein